MNFNYCHVWRKAHSMKDHSNWQGLDIQKVKTHLCTGQRKGKMKRMQDGGKG